MHSHAQWEENRQWSPCLHFFREEILHRLRDQGCYFYRLIVDKRCRRLENRDVVVEAQESGPVEAVHACAVEGGEGERGREDILQLWIGHRFGEEGGRRFCRIEDDG